MSHKTTEIIKFTAPHQLKHQLQQLADDRHISLAALIRLVLTEYLKKHT